MKASMFKKEMTLIFMTFASMDQYFHSFFVLKLYVFYIRAKPHHL